MKQLVFAYDFQGRRVSKTVYNWNGASYSAQSTNRFVYDGWNLVAELDGSNTPVRSYLWGLDLSGSLQGAGGVGGLLAVNAGANGVGFASFDGNGNVTALVDTTSGALSANYEYGPFGEVVRATGSTAKHNPFRFSTKYQDDQTDLLYYGYRYLNTLTGVWSSRDPLGERGGEDLYGFVGNNPLSRFDRLGLCACICQDATITFNPGGGTFSWGIVTDPDTQKPPVRLGNNINVKWLVQGECKLCDFRQDETGISISSGWNDDGSTDWDGSAKQGTDSGIAYGNFKPDCSYYDKFGVYLQKIGYYYSKVKGKIVFKCTGSDKNTVTKTLTLEASAIAVVPSSGAPTVKVQKVVTSKVE